MGLLTIGLRSVDEKISVSLRLVPGMTRQMNGFGAIMSGFSYILIALSLFSLPFMFFSGVSINIPRLNKLQAFIYLNFASFVLAVLYVAIVSVYKKMGNKSGKMKK